MGGIGKHPHALKAMEGKHPHALKAMVGKHPCALKGQKLLAQGNALGIIGRGNFAL